MVMKKDGKGIGGSMHLVDLKNNFYGSTAIVSNSIPIGVGLAYSIKLAKKKLSLYLYWRCSSRGGCIL